MSAWLDELNPAQREAVTAGDGPVLVVAGAGTGKTKTLACRVAWLIERGVPAERILLLTFTRRAAAEMIGRATRLAVSESGGRVWGGTFHAIAHRLLRVYGQSIGLAGDFTVMDQGDAADLLALLRNELGLASRERRFPNKDTLLKIYSHVVNAQRPLAETLENHFPWCMEDEKAIGDVFSQYVQRKSRRHLLDYDDLLLFWRALVAAPGAGESVANRFEHILVDEYQDTNVLQADILRGMRKKHENLMVVGDDAQAIYSFRAATVRNILDFPEQFAGARIITLEQNYRSTMPILAASNAVMAQARERYTKELWSERGGTWKPELVTCRDEADQTAQVCRAILAHLERGIPLMQQAVLFRAGHHSADLEIELARRNIPFHKFGGLKFVEAAHIKDALAILRIIENSYDEVSWFRVLKLLAGIGPRTASRIMDELGVRRRSEAGPVPGSASANGHSPLHRMLHDPPKVAGSARAEFADLAATLRDCLAMPDAGDEGEVEGMKPGKKFSLAAQVERIARFLEPLFARAYDNAGLRLKDLEQLAQIARRYRSRSRFVTDLTLDPPAATSDLAAAPHLDEDWLTLSTIHSAKGCEWTAVHILHAADGFIPSDMALSDENGLEEERRLLYVAMTRAKDHLHIYFPLRYYHRRFGMADGHGYAQLCRFLSVLDREYLHRTGGNDSPASASEVGQRVADDLRRLWG